jgi:hypothetical protein
MPQFEPEHTPVSTDAFTRGYLDCAEWLLDEEIDRSAVNGWALEAITQAAEDCADFQKAQADDLDAYYETYKPRGNYDTQECAGHDFFLTRNGHGSGFWYRGLGALGERLSKAAKVYSSADAYLGDDGFLYFM